MKCPKCGYTSFDFLDNCKKCGQDLGAHKNKFGLRSVIFPQVDTAPVIENAAVAAVGTSDEASDFGFDFMGDQEPTSGQGQGVVAAGTESPPQTDLPEADFDFSPETADAVDETGADEVVDFDTGEDDGIAFHVDKNEDLDFSATDEETIDFGDEVEDIDLNGQPTEEPAKAAAEEDFDFSIDEPEPNGDQDDREPSDPFDQRGPVEVGRAPEPETQLLIDEFDREIPSEREPTPEISDPDADGMVLSFAEASEETVPADSHDQQSLPADESARFPVEEDVTPAEEAIITPPVAPRLGATLVDLAILAALLFLFLVAGEWMAPGPNPSLLPTRGELLDLAIPYFIVFFALCFGYFTLFHFLTGQTPGKMLFHLQVEGEDGSALTFGQAFLRSVGGLLCLLTAGLGFLAILMRPSRRGWNDDLAGSRLVCCRDGNGTTG